jgi:hypothetical protein
VKRSYGAANRVSARTAAGCSAPPAQKIAHLTPPYLRAQPATRCQIWPSFYLLSFYAACRRRVARIWPLLFLHYRDNAKLKWQFLLLEVHHSAFDMPAVPWAVVLDMLA